MKIYVFILLLISSNVFAQHKKNNIKSINTIGISHGDAGNYLNIKSVNGITKERWFAGLGLGVDLYKHNSIVVTADCRKYLFKNNNFGINGAAGYNFPFANKNKTGFITFDSYYNEQFRGGLYSTAGLFYEFKLLKKIKGIINPDFNIRRLSRVSKDVVPCLVAPCPEIKTTYSYNLQTFSIKTGVIF